MNPFLFLAASHKRVIIMGRKVIGEVSKMQGRGGFRLANRGQSTAIVNQAVERVLGADALPHVAMIASAIATPSEPTSQKYLRRFGITAEKLEQLKTMLQQGYTQSLAERGQEDPALEQ